MHGLAFRYSLFFVTASIIIFIIAFYYTFDFALKLMVDGAKREARTMTELTVSRIENIIRPIEQVPLTLVHSLDHAEPRYAEIHRLTGDVVLDDPVVFGSCMAFEPYVYKKGLYWFAPYSYETRAGLKMKILGSRDYDYFQQDWFRLPKLLNRPVWTEPYYDKGGGDTLMCTYAVPFYRTIKGKPEFRGVLTLDISLASLDRIVKSVKVYSSGYGFLVSHKGTVITHPETGFQNKNIRDITRRNAGVKTRMAVEAMLRGESGFVRVEGLKMNPEPSFIYYAPVASTDWSFAIIFEEKDLMAGLIDFIKRLLLIVGLSVLAILVVTILITRKFTRPITRLVEVTHRIGRGDFYAALPINRSKDEISQLTNAFALMQEELVTYIHNLRDATIAKEKIESELNVAHSIQMDILPRGFLQNDAWDLHALLDSAKAVGGDLYDFFFQDENHLVIAIGDVAGKGVPAALFMMVTRTLLRAKAISGQPIHEVMKGLNTELNKDNPHQMFVTFVAGILDLRTGVMEYCNAGHNVPLHADKNNRIEALRSRNGLPLGIFEAAEYSSQQFIFQPGDTLVLYTDGVTEAVDAAGAFYTEARLTDVISKADGSTASALTAGIEADVREFATGTEQSDDITLLVLKYKGSTGNNDDTMQTRSIRLTNQLSELDQIVAVLEDLSGQWNIPPKVMMELNLVVEELFTNIVFYAFEKDTEHVILLDFELQDAHTLRLTIRDDGKPFNLLEKEVEDAFGKPLEERKIGGLGIHFVKEMMTAVEYQRTEAQNVVILTKNF
jgi:sigma-B regulation protein RsbU (phosphoserine phosphatase)